LNSPKPAGELEGERQTDDCGFYGGLYSQISHNDAIINQTEWHTYSLEWTPTEMNTYYDNKLVKHMDKYASDFDPMNIILDIEGGFNKKAFQHRFCKEIDTSILTTFNFEIDFVPSLSVVAAAALRCKGARCSGSCLRRSAKITPRQSLSKW
jgi:hypothetical protein